MSMEASKDPREEMETAEGAAEDNGVEKAAVESETKTEESADSGENGQDVSEQETIQKDKKDEQIEELQDRLKRQIAEFDNYRKRTEKEKAAMYEVGARDIIERILPVLDNFERGLAVMPEDMKGSSFAEGVEKIYKQFIKTLEDAGVEVIEAVGQQFDANLHNAVMHVEDEAYGENEICQELQKGYKYRGTVVRYSMVQVAN